MSSLHTRKSAAGNMALHTARERSIASALCENVALLVAARPGIRAALNWALNRFPGLKRRLKSVLSQANLRAAVDANRRRREASGVDDLSAYAARVFNDLERERIRLARQADHSR